MTVKQQYEQKQINVKIAKEAETIRKSIKSISDKTVFMNEKTAKSFEKRIKQISELADSIKTLSTMLDDSGNLPSFW